MSRAIVSFLVLLGAAHAALAANVPSYQRTKVCNPAETFCADVNASSQLTVAAYQVTSPWLTSRSWSLSSGTDSIAAVQSGTWTVQQGSAPWSVSQSGAWTTGRTWTLSSGSDSIAAVQSGTWATRLQDGSGNAITSQASSAQRALDVGIDVAGVQVDPRTRTWNLSSSDVPLVSQGTAAAASGAWTAKVTDGTNVAAVKAASTAPLATDPSLVVTQSPNSPAATSANQSTEITALQLIDNPVGSVTGGTAGTSSYLIGGQYNSTAPALTTGQQAALQLDATGRVLISGNVAISTLPAFSSKSQIAINAGVTTYSTYTATGAVAIKQFYAGGTGIGRQTLYLYTPSTTSFVTGGDFEAAGDCGTTWLWSSTAGTGSIAQSAVQANTGTKSCALTFTNSAGNNAQVVGETISLNVTTYRYLNAAFFNVVSAGGAYTRTISIILTDTSSNTRTYSVSGSSTAGAFSTSAWIPIQAELENPTSSVGTFDPSAVASVKLQMSDSANKAGTVYWDTVRFSNLLTPLFPIYHAANVSFNILADPVVVLANGDQIIVGQQNNDTVRKEFFSLVGGVSL